MIFRKIQIDGPVVIEIEPIEDERGFFARSFCCDRFYAHGLNTKIAQCNISYNRKKGTLMGMHYQAAPAEEAKLIRCVSGSIYDVILDLRPGSSTYGQWAAIILASLKENTDTVKVSASAISSRPGSMLYVPEGFAHGFQTLADATEVFYQMSSSYRPELARGVRWDDPSFGIVWPLENPIISEKDKNYPLVEV